MSSPRLQESVASESPSARPSVDGSSSPTNTLAKVPPKKPSRKDRKKRTAAAARPRRPHSRPAAVHPAPPGSSAVASAVWLEPIRSFRPLELHPFGCRELPKLDVAAQLKRADVGGYR